MSSALRVGVGRGGKGVVSGDDGGQERGKARGRREGGRSGGAMMVELVREGERCWEMLGQGGTRWDHGRLGGRR